VADPVAPGTAGTARQVSRHHLKQRSPSLPPRSAEFGSARSTLANPPPFPPAIAGMRSSTTVDRTGRAPNNFAPRWPSLAHSLANS